LKRHAAAHAGAGATLFLDVPEVNRQAQQVIAELRLAPVFDMARMYTGSDPEIDLGKLFDVTAFELGKRGTGRCAHRCRVVAISTLASLTAEELKDLEAAIRRAQKEK
jgi:hypothetical protein